jgi:3-methylfumaryl-CoA hydratase
VNDKLDLGVLRSAIGRQEITTGRADPEIVARFRATLGLPAAQAETGPAPLLLHLCLGQPAAATSDLGEDGHPRRGGFLPPVPLPRRMWAGGEMVFHDQIRIGEPVRRRSTIRDVVVKEGRSGVLCFVTVDHEILGEDGRSILGERQDIVYRDLGGGPAPSAPPAPAGEHVRSVTPSSTLLFRYSALTFNGHRIHYDLPYARDVEGYPGLVVHGPLQATLLAHFAAEVQGRPPSKFRFRSLSPLFDTSDFTLNAVADGDSLRLWTAATGGPVAMEATAGW